MTDPDLTLLLAQSAKAVREDPIEARERFHAAAKAAAPEKPGVCGRCGVHHRRITTDQCQDRAVTEAKLQASVVGKAKRRGWTVAHAGRGFVGGGEEGEGHWVTPMLKGWPDLTLIKEGHRLIFIELKRELGEFEEGQLELLALLNTTGNYAIVVRPSDNREGRVNDILRDGAPI